jgi:hypothetical protein
MSRRKKDKRNEDDFWGMIFGAGLAGLLPQAFAPSKHEHEASSDTPVSECAELEDGTCESESDDTLDLLELL